MAMDVDFLWSKFGSISSKGGDRPLQYGVPPTPKGNPAIHLVHNPVTGVTIALLVGSQHEPPGDIGYQ